MSIASGSIDLKSLKVAGSGATGYITEIDGGGISVHESGNNQNLNYITINSSGMKVYKNTGGSIGVCKAEFGDIIKFYDGLGTEPENIISSFGEEVIIGKESESRIYLGSDSIRGVGQKGKEFFHFNGNGPVDTQTFNISLIQKDNYYRSPNELSYGFTGTFSRDCSEELSLSSNQTIDIYVNVYIEGFQFMTRQSYTQYAYVTCQNNVSQSNIPIDPSIQGSTCTIGWDGTSATINYSFEPATINQTLGFTSPTSFRPLRLDFEVFLSYRTQSITPTFILGDGTASGKYSLSEGHSTSATGSYSKAIGSGTTASGEGALATGISTLAKSRGSFSGGENCKALSSYSFSFGYNNISEGYSSTTLGANGKTLGSYDFTQGVDIESARGSAIGAELLCAGKDSFTIGHFNKQDTSGFSLSSDTYVHTSKDYYRKYLDNYVYVGEPSGNPSTNQYYEFNSDSGQYAFVIGNGSGLSASNRSNALTVDWFGNVNIASGANYKVNGTALQNAVIFVTGGNSTDASINANTYGSVTTTATIPSGYIVVGVARITSNHPSALRMTGFDLDLDGKIIVYYHNASSSNFTNIRVATQVACIKQVL